MRTNSYRMSIIRQKCTNERKFAYLNETTTHDKHTRTRTRTDTMTAACIEGDNDNDNYYYYYNNALNSLLIDAVIQTAHWQ